MQLDIKLQLENNKTEYFYCEYSIPEKLEELLKNIPKYKDE